MDDGRWSRNGCAVGPSATEWSTAIARQLLARHGVLTREAMNIESVPGGYSAVYDVLRAMEDAGRVRRGLFVDGLGAAQFALPAALDVLRSVRDADETPLVVTLASTDPANPYGGILKWPASPDGGRGATRSVGTRVVLVDGELTAWLGRGDRQMLVWLPEDEPQPLACRTGARLRARPPCGCGLRTSGLARRGDQRRRHRRPSAREISGRGRLRLGRDGNGEGAPSVIGSDRARGSRPQTGDGAEA